MPLYIGNQQYKVVTTQKESDAYDLDTYLNFYMPFGGTITLHKVGSPTVVELEYSTDGGRTWQIWEEVDTDRTLTLPQEGRMWIRNTSETSTMFSTSTVNYYQFSSTNLFFACGNIASLKCKTPVNAVANDWDFVFLFQDSPICSSPILSFTKLKRNYYRAIFRGTAITRICTYMTDISAQDCLLFWVYALSISTKGDFYCHPELTIPTGRSGIPSGWTRHDLSELDN